MPECILWPFSPLVPVLAGPASRSVQHQQECLRTQANTERDPDAPRSSPTCFPHLKGLEVAEPFLVTAEGCGVTAPNCLQCSLLSILGIQFVCAGRKGYRETLLNRKCFDVPGSCQQGDTYLPTITPSAGWVFFLPLSEETS